MKIIRLKELCRRLGLHRSTVWRYRERYSDFPKPVIVNGIHPRWVSDEVDAWLLSRRETPKGDE